jgi:hypothetical protein
MSIEFTIRKGTTNPTSGSGITLGEPAFNYSNNTLFIGKGYGVTAAWVGAGICGASGGIAAGLTYQIPTLGAVKDYFTAVSSNFLGTTASYVASFNGLTGAVAGVASVNGSTGAVVTYAGTTGNIPYRYGAGVGITANSYFSLFDGDIGDPTDILILSGPTGPDYWRGNTEAIGLRIVRNPGGIGLDEGAHVSIDALGQYQYGADQFGSGLRLTTPNIANDGPIRLAPKGTDVVAVGSYGVSIYAPLSTTDITAIGGATFSGNFSGTTGSFSKLLTASAGISASSVAVSGRISSTQGITFGSATNFMAFVPQSSATNGGLWIKEGVFQIGGSALLQGSGSLNYSGNTELLNVYGHQVIDNSAGYQGIYTPLIVKGGTGQSVPLFNVTRGGTSAVQVDQNGILVAALGLSAAGATFSGSIGLQNAEFIRNTTNGRVDIMPAPAAAAAYGLYVDTTGWGYGPQLGTIQSSTGTLNNGNILFNAPLVISNDVSLILGSSGTSVVRHSSTGLDTMQLGVAVGNASYSGAVAIYDYSVGSAANRSPGISHSNPNLYVYRAGSASANDFIRTEHNGTNANIVSGGSSGILIQPGSGVLGISGAISAGIGIFSSYIVTPTIYNDINNGNIIDFSDGTVRIGDAFGDDTGRFIHYDQGEATLHGNESGLTNFSTLTLTSVATIGDSATIGAGGGLVDSTSTALGTTAADQPISQSVVSASYRSVEFFVQASTAGGAYEALKIMVVHNGTTTYNTQYGVVRSGATLGTYTTILATVAGVSRIRLRVTPTAVNTTYKVMINALPV